jgi:hypothetical protein
MTNQNNRDKAIEQIGQIIFDISNKIMNSIVTVYGLKYGNDTEDMGLEEVLDIEIMLFSSITASVLNTTLQKGLKNTAPDTLKKELVDHFLKHFTTEIPRILAIKQKDNNS